MTLMRKSVAEGGDVERLREEVAFALGGVGFLEEDVGARGRLVKEPDVDPLSALEVAQRRRVSALNGADGRGIILLDEEVNRLAEKTVQELLLGCACCLRQVAKLTVSASHVWHDVEVCRRQPHERGKWCWSPVQSSR